MTIKDTEKDTDIILLQKQIEAFIHIVEMLARCRQHTGLQIDPDAIQRLARVFNLHITNTPTPWPSFTTLDAKPHKPCPLFYLLTATNL